VHHGRVGAALEVVAVEADVEISERDLRVEQLFELRLQSPRKERPR
jgi:hypothetical protein